MKDKTKEEMLIVRKENHLFNKTNLSQSFMLLLLLMIGISTAQAQTPQETLTQYVADLQKNPDDAMLREKIIRHAQTMRPSPGIPEEAKRFLARGKAAFRDAKEPRDFSDAADEFKKALLYAPWLAEGYYNLGIIQDKAGQYGDAIQSLKLYLLAAPQAPDAEKVKELIYEIEYRKDKAAEESSPEAVAAKKRNVDEEWLRRLNGAQYFGQSNVGNDLYFENELTIRGNTLSWRQRITYYGPKVVQDVPLGQWYDLAPYGGRMQIVGREAKRMMPGTSFINDIFTISADGNSITQVEQASNGGTFTFYRQ